MTNKEQIEAFFDNQLSPEEKESFLGQVENDPALKAEFDFQQNVIDGIKAYRKQELIARLNNVRIVSGAQSMLIKAISIAGIVTVLSGAAYWYYTAENSQSDLAIATTQQTETPLSPMQIEPEVVEEESTPINIESKKAVEEKSNTTAPIKAKKEVQAADKTLPQIELPEVTEPAEEHSIDVQDDLEAPDAMGASSISIRSSNDVEVKLSKKYKFHYQIVDGDLILYGDFSDFPFEVIELKTSTGINSYLYYNEMFYGLSNDASEISPLKTLTNEALIVELKKRR